MPRSDKLFKWLKARSDAAVDRALAAALPSAKGEDRKRIAFLILERAEESALLALVRHYHEFEPVLQDAVVANADSLFSPLREASTHASDQSRINVTEIIRRSRTLSLSYLVDQHLYHGRPAIRAAAAQCLLELSEHSAALPRELADSEERYRDHRLSEVGYVQEVVEKSITNYDRHQQPAVLLAAMVLSPRRMPIAAEALNRAGATLQAALRQVVHGAPTATVARAAWWLLGRPAMAETIIHSLPRLMTPEGFGPLLETSHLIELPAQRYRFQQITNADPLIPTRKLAAHLSPDQQAALPRWIDRLPLDPQIKLQSLSAICHSDHPRTRLAALRRLMELGRGGEAMGVEKTIGEFCHDEDAAVARIALRHLIRCGWRDLPQLLPQLVNSRHPSVRSLAAGELSRIGFARLWDGWPHLNEEQRIAAGRAMIKIDPTFHRSLGRRLEDPRPTSRLRALSIIHTLAQGEFFEPALIRLAKSRDDRVASAAVMALGGSYSEDSLEVIEQSLEHPDSRVRANAVEALEQHKAGQLVEKLVAMTRDEENRPRANAIRAMIREKPAEAIAALDRMMGDGRVKHRISALWVIASLGLVQLSSEVADLAVSDPEPRVREAAEKTIAKLTRMLRESPIPPESGATA